MTVKKAALLKDKLSKAEPPPAVVCGFLQLSAVSRKHLQFPAKV